MKKLLIVTAFVAASFISGTALAGDCQHGGYAQSETKHDEMIIAKETDAELLELLRKQREKEALELQAPVYN